MIVTWREAQGIRSGRKTAHLLPRTRTPPEEGELLPVAVLLDNPALGYTEDGAPRRERVRLCRVTVLGVEAALVRQIGRGMAPALGYRDMAHLLDDWFDPDSPVWVVTFRLDPTQPVRLLAREVIAGRQGDYTEMRARAMSDEGEAVDEFTLERFTGQARRRDRDREQERRYLRGEMPFESQVEMLANEARERHIDVRDELRAIRRWSDPTAQRRQLESMRRKLERRAA